MNRPRLVSVLWSGHANVSPGGMLAAGALVWGGYSVIQVLVNGIVLDETVVPAQIITNAVTYPPGHPHDVFYRGAYSLAHFVSAAMWKLLPDAAVISALRNWLVLWTSLLAPFAAALALTRRPYWAHAAVMLVLLEAPLRYAGVYPMWIFPNYYSNGNIGLHVAVLTAGILALRMWRTGGVLLGLMPGIHATIAMIVWPWAALILLFTRTARTWVARRAVAIGFAAGGAVSVGLALVIMILPDAVTAADPYISGLPGGFRDNFISLTDVHRRPLPWIGMGYLLHMAGFGLVAYFIVRGVRGLGDANAEEVRESTGWLLLLGVGSWAVVWSAHLFHVIVGWLPDLVVTVMPWRFSNVSAVLLVPLTIGAIVGSIHKHDDRSAATLRIVVAALLLVAAVAALPGGFRGLVSRNLLILFWGVLLGAELARPGGRAEAGGALLAMFTVTLVYRSVTYSAFYLVAATVGTAVVVAAVPRLARSEPLYAVMRQVRPAMWVAAVVVAGVAALPDRTDDRIAPDRMRWDMMSDADVGLRRWLEGNAAPGELVLTPFYPRAELQSKTNQPVLLELETLWIMTYMPRLAPVIGTMVLDLYGVDYRDADGLAEECQGQVHPWCTVWSDRWPAWSVERWTGLAQKYGFRHVLSPVDVPLHLPVVWVGGHWRLYEIPVDS